MAQSNTFALSFRLRKMSSKPNYSSIQARVSVGDNRVGFSLNRSIRTDLWDSTNRKAKGSSIESKQLNLFLQEVQMNIFIAYDQLRRENRVITAMAVKSRYLNEDTSDLTLLMTFEYHNREITNTLAPGTARHYKTCLAHTKRFLKVELGIDDIYLKNLTYSFITRFELYLRNYTPIDHQKPLGNNTIMKHIQRLRKVVTLAVKMEWLDKDPFTKYKCKFTPSKRKFLSEDELNRFEGLDNLGERLQYIKDLFVFSCYTGLVYIDTMNLTPNHIVIGIDGTKWIYTDRQKSSKSVKIPLLPKAEEITTKYRNHPKSVYQGSIFPRISNQRLNSYLKELASLAEISSKLTFHVARHTFATTVALMNGLPIETLSKILGHSKITTTQMYAKVLSQKVSEDMSNLKLAMQAKEEKRKKDTAISSQASIK